MNFSAPFVNRPVMTTLLMLGLLIFGIVGYFSLPVNNLPNVDFPTIQVSANLPGASPETMASSVATPLEKQFSTIAGIDSMTSSSSLGSTKVTLQFALDRDIDAAASDVEAAISAATKQLPNDMPNPPTYRKVNPAESPILFVALSSSVLPLSVVDKYAETLLAQQISTIDGVAQVDVFGSQKYAVRVQLDPDILAARGIGMDDVMLAVKQNNVNLPTGTLSGHKQMFLIQATGQLEDANAYKDLTVAYRNGNSVKLGSLGRVIDDVENNKVASWFNNDRAIILAIQRQPGSNTIAVVNAIKKIMPSFTAQLPKNIDLQMFNDKSQSIRDSVREVEWTLISAMILVVIVIFIFLRQAIATLIPGITLPLAVMGSFAAMQFFGYSINSLSLLAIVLAVGFVVDDAIVVLENIIRHKEQGKTTLQAVLDGSKEISFTVISMTTSLAVVFVPILFMGGMIGRLFHEFAVTICVTILLSGIISLTLTPMMCSKLFANRSFAAIDNEHGWQRFAENYFNRLLELYKRSLYWIMAHKKLTLWTFLASLLLVVCLFAVIPKGFLPNEDIGQLMAFTEADSSMSFDAMVEKQHIAQEIIAKNSNVAYVMSTVGSGGAGTSSNTGRFSLQLKSRGERNATADAVVQQLRPQLSKISGLRIFLQNIPPISIGGRMSKNNYQYTLVGSDIDELNRWSNVLYNSMAKSRLLQDVTTDLQFTGPQVQININRDKAAMLGVTADQIENTLNQAFGSYQMSSIYTPIDTYEVIIELEPEKQLNPEALSQLYVKSSSGNLVPLNTIADITRATGPMSINHQGQLPAVTLSFNLSPGVALSEAVAVIEKVQQQLNLPASVTASFRGTAQTFQDSVTGMGILLIFTILVIYIVLGILYESFIHPLTILSGLPVAGIGALLVLLIFRCELNLYSFIGIIMLTGIVKKNAIMMVDFALVAKRKENKNAEEAILQACMIRFRPIMMTTMAALMGALPIALAIGAGAETRRPLGLAVVGGLLLSQLLTLYITPVIYVYLDRLSAKRICTPVNTGPVS